MSPSANRRESLRLLRRSFRGRRRVLAGLVFWSLVEAIPAFLSGRLIARAADEGFLAQRAGTGFAWLGLLGAAVLVGAWGTREAYRRLAALVEPFRDELVELVVAGSLHRSGATGAAADTAGVARLTQHVEILREAYAGVLMTVQGFVVTGVSALLGLFSLVPAALLFVVPPVAVGLGVFFAALRPMAAHQRRSILADEGIAEAAVVMAGGLRDVVACGAEDDVSASVGRHIDAQARVTVELARFTAVRTGAVAAGGWVPVILLLLGGPWLVRNGASTGALLGALTYVLYGVHPALQTLVRQLGTTGLWLLVTLERVVEGIADVPAASDRRGGEPASPIRFGVSLDGVTFRYGAAPEPVLRDLDLVVPEGDHLAIVGPSGVGKSTLAGVIAGLLRPEAGSVHVGGVPVSDLDPAALARLRVLIPQEAYVFSGTVWDNLTYLRDGAAGADVDAVVDALGMRALLDRLGGYDARLDKEALSGGERQLIALARSYLSPAPIVVLDEATCHLDPAAEAKVEQAFRRRPGTLIVIAHRISSALRADRVLVLDGTATRLGTHRELVEGSLQYRRLVGHWA